MRWIMMNIKKYKQVVNYIFWGIVTTIINLSGYFILTRYMGIGYLQGSIIAWVIAAIFSYIVNKFLVFQKKSGDIRVVIRENVLFYLSRVSSCGVDMLILYVFVGRLGYPDAVIKFISNGAAAFLNYVFNKWIVFKPHGLEEVKE